MNTINLPSPSNNNTIQEFERDFLLSTGGDHKKIVQPIPYQESNITTTQLSTSQSKKWNDLFPFPSMTLETKLHVSSITTQTILTTPDTCPICLHDKIKFRKTTCNHLFCGSCLEQWLSNHSSCPLCKKRLLH